MSVQNDKTSSGTMQPGKMRIYTALVNANDGLTFTELTKEAKLSNPVVSEYLKELQDLGVIFRDPETRRYVLAKIFYPVRDLPNDYRKALKIFAVQIVKMALAISDVDNTEEKEENFRKFLNYTFHYFMVLIWKIIGEATTDLSTKDDLKDQRLVLTMNATINNAFKDWVAPIANSLAVAIGLNIDIVNVGEQFFWEILKEATQNMHELTEIIRR